MGSLFGGDNDDALARVRQSGQQARNVLSNFQPVNLDAGGLQTTFNNNRLGVTASPERQQAVSGLAGAFRDQAGALGDLRGQVEPGMGRLTSARLQEIENARQRSIGNLRENLQRRRVLGSSFGADALTRAETEFAQQSEQAAAEGAMQELQLSNELLNQEFEAAQNAFRTQLESMNAEADLGAQLSTRLTDIMAQLTQAEAESIANTGQREAEMIAQSQEGMGQAVGQIGSAVGGALGQRLGGPVGGQVGSAIGGNLPAFFS